MVSEVSLHTLDQINIHFPFRPVEKHPGWERIEVPQSQVQWESIRRHIGYVNGPLGSTACARAGPLRAERFAPQPPSPKMTGCNPAKQIDSGKRVRGREDRARHICHLSVANPSHWDPVRDHWLYRGIYSIRTGMWRCCFCLELFFTVYDMLRSNWFTECPTPCLFHDKYMFFCYGLPENECPVIVYSPSNP